MKECINDYYIENNQVIKCDEFNEEVISEGKSIYEVIRVIEGTPLFLKEHLARMENSCKLEGKTMLLENSELEKSFKELFKFNNIQFGNVKLVFNYKDSNNTSLLYFIKHSYPKYEQYENGVDTTLFFGERSNPNAKVINLSFRNQVEKIMKEKDAYEAILIDKDGFITEGSKSNIFMVDGDEVVTSPLNMVLPGITRNVIINIIKELGMKFEERKISYKEIHKLNGLFITGTSPKVLPIKSVDDIFFKSSKNENILKIMEKYDNMVKKYINYR
jgi:branched-chain amino acid aminotransferase